MQTVSANYLAAITADERVIAQQVLITFVDNETLGKAITATAGEAEPDLLPAENAVDGKSLVSRTMAFADPYDETDAGGRARVYPSEDLYPMNESGGWWGDTLSDVDGDIAGGETLLLEYADAVQIKTVRWAANAYLGRPVDFLVEAYVGAAWTTLADVTGHAAETWTLELDALLTVTKLRITITQVNQAYSFAKLQEFEGGMTADMSVRVQSWEILKERETEGSIPIGNASKSQLTLVMDNTDGVFYRNSGSLYAPYLKANRKIVVWVGVAFEDGSTEMLSQGVYYSVDWYANTNEATATVHAWDQAKRLEEDNYQQSSVVEDYSIAELARMLALAAGLDTSEISIDTGADAVVRYGWFEAAAYWLHLKTLAQGEGGQVYFNEQGQLVFESRAYLSGLTTPVATLTDDDTLIGVEEKWEQGRMKNSIKATTRPLTVDATQQVLALEDTIVVWDSGFPGGGPVTIVLMFDQIPCINVQTPVLDAVHVVIDSWTPTAWGGTLVVSIDGPYPSGTIYGITVDADPLIESGGVTATAEDSVLISQNGKMVYEVPEDGCRFIQDLETAQALVDDLLTMLGDPGGVITAQMRGRPELQLADRVTIQDEKTENDDDYWIIRIRMTYDGGLSEDATLLKCA